MKLKLFLVLFISQFALFAQNTGTLNGIVVDNTLKQPMPYVNVSIFDNDKLVTGGITRENGSFALKDIPLKKLKVEIAFIGYKKITREITFSADNQNVNLNTISLEEDAIQLKGVEVISERSTIEQKIDRKVINIGKDIIASGNTASDILNNVPTVSVDAQTKEISLRGNTNVRVLIDGKPSNIDAAQLLQQIPSSSIKQVELITNPSAKYNPEGMSGIINIILHKNSNEGFNGSINSGVTFGVTPKTNQALNLNYKVGKVNFYANYGFNHGKNRNFGNVNSERPNFENRQDFNSYNKNTSHLFKFGVDFYMDEKNTFSIYTNQNISLSSGAGVTSVDYQNAALRDSNQYTDQHNENNTQTYDFVYKHDFTKKGETLDFQANYSKTDNPDESQFNYIQENPITNTLTFNDIQRDINYLQLNVDYVNPLTESVKLELGAETRLQNIKNNFDENVSETSSSYNRVGNSNFDFTRNIHSFYTNIGKQWEKWSAQAGVRIEQYEIDGDFERVVTSSDASENINDKSNITDKIFTAYPSVFLNYKANDKDSFNFNYSRRVDRPSIGQISPIREWTTPLIESRGNPSLEPQFTNSFEVNYTRITKIGSITAGTFYRLINDEIGRIVYKNPDNPAQDIISYNNFDNNKAYGVEVSANLKFAKWWSVNASSDAYFKTVRGTVENGNTGVQERAQVDVTVFNIRMNHNFVATKELRFNLFGMYRGADLGLQYERKPMYRMDFGASYNILKGKGTITARANDIFKTMKFAFDGSIPYKQEGSFNWESRTIYVGFNYNFGGGKNRALQRKQRDANETQSSGGMI
ncbi:outer membrane beta-barrel family protein [Flavobacterium capsici]|uniref:Outer membrane beta-barrel family protein n=1 Tax=Flavobacterium capsici TaxID=3075618 RepID=A0AA96EXD1_9FLAO|nr:MULTISPECIES: outer membrane beta-barrel family protein [unclassified Flavobacterium]WNM18968.1 outer membrane beta-barrel family protein [Flavobacterium sp. PMR2A8]WNM23018.1 outer membrane beta-barrel family protein [Flavobacterium sp. PMTSA4]